MILCRVLKPPVVRMLWLALGILAAMSGLGAPAIELPEATRQESRYEFKADHDPHGTGRFYMGREIARVMGHQGAEWLERPERDREEHSGKVVGLLGLNPGEVVADIGAGTGYFSRRLARAVGPEGKVLAVDIQPEMLVIMTNRLAQEGLTNVLAVLGEESDPKLSGKSVDLVLMVDVYHELAYPWEMMRRLCESLKPGGRVVLVEFRAEDPAVPIKTVHKMTEAQVKREMSCHPLIWVETRNELPRQHLIVFRKREPVGRPGSD